MNIKIFGYELKNILDKLKNIKSDLLIKTIDDNTAMLIVGDLELSMEHDVKCEVYESGVVEIPQELVQVLSTIEDYIIITDELISYSTGQIKYKSSLEMFNPIIDFNNRIYSIKECELLKSLNNVKHAVAVDETRPILTGIDFKDDKVMALDGFRLSVEQLTSTINTQITLPKQCVVSLTKMLNKKSDNLVVFDLNDKCDYIKITIGELQIISKLLDGNYPNFESIIPKDCIYKFEIDSIKFLKIFKVMFKCKKDDKEIAILNFENDKLIISNKKINCTNTINIKTLENGDLPFEIAFNPKYIIDVLKKYNGLIELELTSNVSSMLIKKGSSLDLVLPVRLS